MDDDMHMYDVVNYQGGGQKIHDKAERVTCFDGEEEEYVSLHDPQEEGSSRYQEPQWCAKNMKTAVSNDEVKGSSDCHGLKGELKQMNRCLCMLSLLVVILFLMTLASLSLAAYVFYNIESSASTHLNVTNQETCQLQNLITALDTRINDTIVQVVTLVSLQNVVSMIESRVNETNREVASLISLRATVSNLESQLNTINSEVISQRNFVNNLESRLNGTNSQISTLTPLKSSVTSLQSQLRMTNTTISSLQLAIGRQPSKQMCIYMWLSHDNVALSLVWIFCSYEDIARFQPCCIPPRL